MKLEKAIEITKLIVSTGHYQPTIDDVDALKLLIEAGKAIRDIRQYHHLYTAALLPGETGPEEEPLAVEPLIEQIGASLRREAEKRRGKHEPDDKG